MDPWSDEEEVEGSMEGWKEHLEWIRVRGAGGMQREDAGMRNRSMDGCRDGWNPWIHGWMMDGGGGIKQGNKTGIPV